jgi:hypothetical protein
MRPSMRASFTALAATFFLLAGCSPAAPPASPRPAEVLLAEGLPKTRQQQIQQFVDALAKTRSVRGLAPEAVVAVAKRWAAGATVKVAFRGGNLNLHRAIEAVTAIWTQHANIGFDFGYDSARRSYRTWAPTDSLRAAEIRIAFDEPGYWSCVGTDSMLDACATAQQSSMNFQRFDVALPSNWASTVLHEFGHALGLEHEHQNPENGCESEFVWDDEPGYNEIRDQFKQFVPDVSGHRPGLYRVLGGPLNYWDRETVERNMKQLPNSRAFQAGPFDKDSIMKYEFPAWQFKTYEKSRCYSVRNETLSTGDRVGIAGAYPRELVSMRNALSLQVAAITEVTRTVPAPSERQSLRDFVDSLTQKIQQLK